MPNGLYKRRTLASLTEENVNGSRPWRAKSRGVEQDRGGYVQFGCGVADGTQLQLAAGRTRSGGMNIDSVVFNGKIALIPLTDGRPGLTIAYSVQGSHAPSQSMRVAQTLVKAVYSAPFAEWLVHGNVGWLRDRESRRDGTLWNLAVERSALGPFDWVAEVYGDDRAPAWLGTGARYWVIDKRIWIDLSFGRQMSAVRPRLLTVGVSGFL